MPLYRKSGGSGAGGIPAVLLVHPDGTSQEFTPTADTDAARGVALLAAFAAYTPSADLIVIGVGAFECAAGTDLPNLNIRGQGDCSEIKSADPEIPSMSATAGTLRLDSLKVGTGGVSMNGGSLSCRDVRIDTSGSASCVPVVRLTNAGTLTLKQTDLKSHASVACISTATALNCVAAGATANTNPDALVTVLPDGGLFIDANTP